MANLAFFKVVVQVEVSWDDKFFLTQASTATDIFHTEMAETPFD